MGERGLTGNSVSFMHVYYTYGFNWSDIKKQTINLRFFFFYINNIFLSFGGAWSHAA